MESVIAYRITMESINDQHIRNCVVVNKLLRSLEQFGSKPQDIRGIYYLTSQLSIIQKNLRKSDLHSAADVADSLSVTIKNLQDNTDPNVRNASVANILNKRNPLFSKSLITFLDPYSMKDSVYEFIVKIEPMISATC